MRKISRITAILLLFGASILALFEEEVPPARMLGMGGATVAAGESADAVPFNPATAAFVERVSLAGTYSHRWSLEGFAEYSAVIVVPVKIFTVAAFWHERSVFEVYGERTAAIVFAREFYKRIAVGFGIGMFSASAPGAALWAEPSYDRASFAPRLDFGATYSPISKIRFAFAARNILSPEIKILSTTEDADRAGFQLAFGTSWEVANDLHLVADVVSEEGNASSWQPRLGMEIAFFDVLSVRAGSMGERLCLGAGLKADRWSFDAALSNHRWLGNIYILTMNLIY